MAEKDWISRYFAPLATAGARKLQDDAGLLGCENGWLIATTDAMVEGVHFLTGQDARSVGKKLVRVNVSDVLAKGAKPFEALLTIGWPDGRSEADLAAFATGFREELLHWNIGLVGGDTVSSPIFFVSLTLTGSAAVAGSSPVWMKGAMSGEIILLTGKIGGSAGLADARAGRATPAADHYLVPDIPPLQAARLISQHASAATDVSDGLLEDLSQILSRSERGGRVDLEKVRLWGDTSPIEDVLGQCTGGDDYQIVCTADPVSAESLVKSGLFYAIGRVLPEPGLQLCWKGEGVNLPETLGFEHGR